MLDVLPAGEMLIGEADAVRQLMVAEDHGGPQLTAAQHAVRLVEREST